MRVVVAASSDLFGGQLRPTRMKTTLRRRRAPRRRPPRSLVCSVCLATQRDVLTPAVVELDDEDEEPVVAPKKGAKAAPAKKPGELAGRLGPRLTGRLSGCG